ncbi:MAG TPA: UDP-N-acetylmuramoyl-tripeptide--D-alanyl-D-alanine ligase [Flavisolibacter sp.]|nr:UDP-N-acetylmuramoyl-tripeptide--D-alanyl-D-alanine ligase [Flavisolibacter sp.]
MKIPDLYNIYLQHSSVQTDTRKLKQGDLFFALKGPSFNGNSFAAKAIEAGAAYAVIDDPAYAIEGRTILVDDVLTALQQLANHHRRQFDIPFLAITGSNGKTTTKELIHAVLSSSYTTYTTEGNFNNHIGIPLTILKIRKDAQMAVIEMGANHQREIASYCTIAEPTHGLITNCGKAHLEGFGGVEGVRKGKGELYDHLRQAGGTAFVMWDYDYLRDMSKGIPEIITYGESNSSIEGRPVATGQYLSVVFSKGLDTQINTSLVGDYNLPNVLAAAAVGLYFKVPARKIQDAIEGYEPTNSRSQLMKKGTNAIVLDAYNANPSSMKAAIINFAKMEGSDKILALGAMAELGEESLQEHQAIVDEIGKHQWKSVILVGGDFAKVNHPYKQFSSSAEAGPWLKEEQPQNAMLLIKGSRSMQMERLLDYL